MVYQQNILIAANLANLTKDTCSGRGSGFPLAPAYCFNVNQVVLEYIRRKLDPHIIEQTVDALANARQIDNLAAEMALSLGEEGE